MELTRCKNGHTYDPTITSECPACAAMEAGHTLPLDVDNLWGGAEQIGKTAQLERGGTLPVNPQPTSWADPNAPEVGGFAPDPYSRTIAKDIDPNASVCRPVTGWLVCVEGVERGRDYRLHTEINFIGRGPENDVVFGSDQTVSWSHHARIAYDDHRQKFYIAPDDGRTIIRLNDNPVLMSMELHTGDRLEIGSGIYLFVPLCGEAFQW